mmetsp:Transcript_11386/g.23791  ORF Transcript_11386/g.23791 Transcript_11386/m.23791 type:complete len:238 (-) Transcript_11386:306-1019(-)
MQRQHPAQGHEVVHHAEDAFLHFAGVLRPKDHQLAVLEVHSHSGGRGHASGVAVAWECPRVDDRHVRCKRLELLRSGPDEHVVHKERVVGAAADDPHCDTALRLPPGKAVEDKHLLESVEVVQRPLARADEGVHIHRNVGRPRPPPHIPGSVRAFYDALILRGPPCLSTMVALRSRSLLAPCAGGAVCSSSRTLGLISEGSCLADTSRPKVTRGVLPLADFRLAPILSLAARSVSSS